MKTHKEQDNSNVLLAIFLIGLGMFLVLRKLGVFYDFSFLWGHEVFYPVQRFFHRLEDVLFSWPTVFVLIGLFLYKTGRSVGVVFLVIGLIFLFPKVLFLTGLSFSFILPLALIIVGVLIIRRAV